MKTMTRHPLRTATFALVMTISMSAAAAAQVKTTGGFVKGTTSADGRIRIFKGIPFAAPPVGELRWKEPRPAARGRACGTRRIRPALHAGRDLRRHLFPRPAAKTA